MWITNAIDFVLHLNRHLAEITAQYGQLTYAILFIIVFCETGLVITPFLPGDSLLFAAGALAAITDLTPQMLITTLMIATFLGDNTNYWIGRWAGPKVFKQENRLLKAEYLHKTHDFYEKYGPKALIIARFIPIFRTFTPFVAGIGTMPYPRFIAYSLIGSALWVGGLITISYYFGNIPIIKNNFSLVIIGIIILSILPPCIAFAKHRLQAQKSA